MAKKKLAERKFTKSDSLCEAHHIVGITPVVAKKKDMLKVVLSFKQTDVNYPRPKGRELVRLQVFPEGD